MTAELGILMFIYNMTALLIGMLIAFFIGIIIAYYIINKVEQERKRKENLEYLLGRKWKKDDTE